MGAINLGGALYGAVRGMQDVEARDQQRQSFDLDQAIRRDALAQSQELAPIRRKAAELGLEEGALRLQNEREEAPLRRSVLNTQLDVSKLTLEQQKRVNDELKVATERKNTLNKALGMFQLNGDPQSVADALSTIYPEAGKQKATVNADGSITLGGEGPDAKPQTFKAGKTADGQPYTAGEAMSIAVSQTLDPVKTALERFAHEQKTGQEVAKQKAIGERASAVAEINAESRGAARGARAIQQEQKRSKGLLDAALKGDTVVGAMISGYSRDEYKVLRAPIAERTAELIAGEGDNEPMNADKAVNTAVKEFSEGYAKISAATQAQAEAVSATGIDPKNAQAVADAAKGGNDAAKRLQQHLDFVKEKFGYPVASYMQSQLKAAKKK